MKTIVMCGFALILTVSLAFTQDKGKGGGAPGKGKAPGMWLKSPDFEDGGIIPDKFTQAAGATAPSPKLEWTQVPDGTQAFTLLFHDPDPAVNKSADDVTHWLIFNIPGTARELPGGATSANLPAGTIQAANLRNTKDYMGPGNGAINPYHHYTFELFALDSKLALDDTATRPQIMEAMRGHVIGKAVLVGRFKRPN